MDPEFSNPMKGEPRLGPTKIPPEAVHARFRRIRRNEIIALVLMYVGVLAGAPFIYRVFTRPNPLSLDNALLFLEGAIVFLAFAVGEATFLYLNWRCPRCRHYLGHGYLFPKTNVRQCPSCRVPLR